MSAGSNDIFKRNPASEEIITRYKQLLKTMKEKCKKSFLIETLPRLNVSNFTLSRALGINARIKDMCKKAEIVFIETWGKFIDNKKMYNQDLTHLNNIGKETLASLIHNSIVQHHASNYF